MQEMIADQQYADQGLKEDQSRSGTARGRQMRCKHLSAVGCQQERHAHEDPHQFHAIVAHLRVRDCRTWEAVFQHHGDCNERGRNQRSDNHRGVGQRVCSEVDKGRIVGIGEPTDMSLGCGSRQTGCSCANKNGDCGSEAFSFHHGFPFSRT